ncbi:MAG: dihydropteroate synthase [Bacteroidales bacterium]
MTKPQHINFGGQLISLDRPRVMGVINITPDSFYKGSRHSLDEKLIESVGKMTGDGADFIDIGGYSSRPGANDIDVEEEKRRVLPAIKLLKDAFPGIIISVDTFRASVAEEAVKGFGADMINDITGGDGDEQMFTLVRRLNVPYILMHMQGTPATMQKNPVYSDIIADILEWFSRRIYELKAGGVNDIIIDPGFGFGKTVTDNFEMLRRFREFEVASLPLMAGISRKSMIWRTLDVDPSEALNGTTVINTIALMNGADILRVHDVKEAAEAVKLVSRMKNDKRGI